MIKIRWRTLMENVREGDSKARTWLIIFCGVVLFVIVAIVGIVRMNASYKTFEVTNTIEKNDDVSVNYQVIGDGLIQYSKDGASFTGKNGTLLWNQAFEMSNAQVVSRGDYMAIADIGSNQMRIFNQAGQIAVIDAIYPVADIELAGQGVVAAVLSDADQHYINLYNSSGEDLVRIKATMTNTGYPVDIAISEDGTKLAVSYLIISEGDVTTQIVFYRFGDLEYTDNIAGTFNYNEIYPKIEFLNNNTLVAFGEQGFEIFSMRDSAPEVVLKTNFDNEIQSIFYNEQYIGFVFRNDGAAVPNRNRQESESVAPASGGTAAPEDASSGNTSGSEAPEDASSGNTSGSEAPEDASGGNTFGPETVKDMDSGDVEISARDSRRLLQANTASTADTAETLGEGESSVGIPAGSPEGIETEMETTDGVYPSLRETGENARDVDVTGDGRSRYRMLVYTNAGRLYLDKPFNFDYHEIVCSNDEIIMYNEYECAMFEYNGNEKFSYEFDSRINSLLPRESKNEYIIIDDNTIREIRLK